MTARLHLAMLILLLGPVTLRGQDPPQDKPEEKTEERPTGLPSPITWTFNLDAGWGTFGFANSLFNNPKEGVEENLSDQWFEGYVKPALSATYTLDSSSQIYGKLSAVGERTYGSVPEAFGQDISSFYPEDLSIGWRSGKSLALGENAIDLTVGRTRYRLGHAPRRVRTRLRQASSGFRLVARERGARRFQYGHVQSAISVRSVPCSCA